MIRYCTMTLLFSLMAGAAFGAQGTTVTYEVNGKPYQGYYISSSDSPPFILLIHDWDGLTEYEVKRAHMLADLGYTVFAADLFGLGVRPTEVKDKRRLTTELYEDRKRMRERMRGALEEAENRGARTNNGVAMGYCFGGTAVLELARSGSNLKGFATFHGGLETPEGQDYSSTGGEILVLHGSADEAVTLDHFAQLAKELESAEVAHEMITYGGARHAFTVFGSDRYHEEADERSWRRFTVFLADTLKR